MIAHYYFGLFINLFYFYYRELTEHDAGKSMVVQTLFDPDASPEAPCLQE